MGVNWKYNLKLSCTHASLTKKKNRKRKEKTRNEKRCDLLDSRICCTTHFKTTLKCLIRLYVSISYLCADYPNRNDYSRFYYGIENVLVPNLNLSVIVAIWCFEWCCLEKYEWGENSFIFVHKSSCLLHTWHRSCHSDKTNKKI